MSKNKVEKIDNKKTKKEAKNKKPNLFVRIGKWFSATWQELKKVSWPKFSTVVKQTGVVLAVVLFFLVVILAINLGLSALLGLIGVGA